MLPAVNSNKDREPQMSNDVAFRRTLSAIVEEYNAKVEAIPSAIAAFNAAGDALKSAATISGTWGEVSIDAGRGIYERDLKRSLQPAAVEH